jgi:periplasmic divalent cation tolerance protein
MDDILLIYTTWPDAETAQAAGEAAVNAHLAACANIFGPIRSIYAWEGRVETASEVPMLLKTTVTQLSALRTLIIDRHPYEAPCFISVSVRQDASHTEFLRWIEEQTGTNYSDDRGAGV